MQFLKETKPKQKSRASTSKRRDFRPIANPRPCRRLERIGAQLCAPMRPLSARRKLIPVAAVITRAVTVGVTDARAHNRAAIGRPVIVIVGRVIRGRVIITAIIRGYVWTLRTSARKSCGDACAEQREQKPSFAGPCFTVCDCFHQMIPFPCVLNFPFFFRDRRFASAEGELRRIRTILISQFPLSQQAQSEHHVAPTRPVRITSLIIGIVPCPHSVVGRAVGHGFPSLWDWQAPVACRRTSRCLRAPAKRACCAA